MAAQRQMTAGVPDTVCGDIGSRAQWPYNISSRAANDRVMGAWLMSSAARCLQLQEDLWISAFHLPVDRLVAHGSRSSECLLVHTQTWHTVPTTQFTTVKGNFPSLQPHRPPLQCWVWPIPCKQLQFSLSSDPKEVCALATPMICSPYTFCDKPLMCILAFGSSFFDVLLILQNFIHPTDAYNDQWYWRYQVPLLSANGLPGHSVLQQWIPRRIHWVSPLGTALAKSEQKKQALGYQSWCRRDNWALIYFALIRNGLVWNLLWKISHYSDSKMRLHWFKQVTKEKLFFLKILEAFDLLKIDAWYSRMPLSLWARKTCLPTMIHWIPGSYRLVYLRSYWHFKNGFKHWLSSSSPYFSEVTHAHCTDLNKRDAHFTSWVLKLISHSEQNSIYLSLWRRLSGGTNTVPSCLLQRAWHHTLK